MQINIGDRSAIIIGLIGLLGIAAFLAPDMVTGIADSIASAIVGLMP